MLKNTKVVGIAAAVTLLTGVALAPSATAVGQDRPYQSDVSNDGGRTYFSIYDIRTGCKATTTLNGKTSVDRATHVVGDSRKTYGEIVDAWVTTPKMAGEYTIKSRINNDCADDAGYSNAPTMSDTVEVGTQVELDSDGNWDELGGGNVRIYGDVELMGGAITQDLGAVKVLFQVRGKTVASTYTDADGYISATIASKYLNKRGNTKVTLSLATNRNYWMDDYEVVAR